MLHEQFEVNFQALNSFLLSIFDVEVDANRQVRDHCLNTQF